MTDFQVGDRVRVITDRVAFCMRGYPGTVVSTMLTGGFDYAVRLDTPKKCFDGIGGNTYVFFNTELAPITETA